MKKPFYASLLLLTCFIVVVLLYPSKPEPNHWGYRYFEDRALEENEQIEIDSAARGYAKLGINPDSVWTFKE